MIRFICAKKPFSSHPILCTTRTPLWPTVSFCSIGWGWIWRLDVTTVLALLNLATQSTILPLFQCPEGSTAGALVLPIWPALYKDKREGGKLIYLNLGPFLIFSSYPSPPPTTGCRVPHRQVPHRLSTENKTSRRGKQFFCTTRIVDPDPGGISMLFRIHERHESGSGSWDRSKFSKFIIIQK